MSESASLVFEADGGWLAPVDTWHGVRMQTLLLLRLCGVFLQKPAITSPSYTAEAMQAATGMLRHVRALHVKDVFQSCSPLITIGV